MLTKTKYNLNAHQNKIQERGDVWFIAHSKQGKEFHYLRKRYMVYFGQTD